MVVIYSQLGEEHPPTPCESYKKVVYVAKAEYLDNKPEAIEYAFAADLLSALETKVNNSFYIGGVVDDHIDSDKINGVFLVDSCVSSGIYVNSFHNPGSNRWGTLIHAYNLFQDIHAPKSGRKVSFKISPYYDVFSRRQR